VNIQEAVKSGFDHFFDWKGRASRPAFWWLYLANVIAVFVAAFIDGLIGLDTLGGGLLYWIAAIAFFFPVLSATIRRLHDTGKSGWWWWIQIIPIIGFIVMLVFMLTKSDEGKNEYGPNPKGGVSEPAGS
jgi:uncharacterized membrane protein YhaH (DUF805 family)